MADSDIGESKSAGGAAVSFVNEAASASVAEKSLVDGVDTVEKKEDEDEGVEVEERETWARGIDFFLACVGFSVGLGNVWRFPYLCYKHGGGAFLIPYFISVFLGGIPMFFMEVCIGQFMSTGGISAWALCPLFKGIGVAAAIIVFNLNVYYNVILAWAIRYLFASIAAVFTMTLPWDTCGNSWNTENCTNFEGSNATIVKEGAIDSATEYWERHILGISKGLEHPGSIKWDLALTLLLAWVIVYLCICKGIKTSGKVMYFTATFPYVLMMILCIRGATLPGAALGIEAYLVPDWTKLWTMEVWVDAGTQIFFSYSISLGTLTALGSYNKFHHNSFRDSIMFALTNSGTSFFAGFVIFMVLGFMAQEAGKAVKDVAESGPGLAFIAYPKAVAQMPLAPLWAILFFFMVLLLGLDSEFVGVEGFVTAVVDLFPDFFRQKGQYRREIFIGITAIISYLIGLSMVTNGGMYVFQLFDYYSGSRIILLIAMAECLVMCYVYGIKRWMEDISFMFGFHPGRAWQYLWMVATPLFVFVMFIMTIANYEALTYNRTYHYPLWGITIGWCLALMSVVMIPIVAVCKLIFAEGTLKERWVSLTTPILKPHQLRPGYEGNVIILKDTKSGGVSV